MTPAAKDDPNDLAIAAIADVLRQARRQPAACAALMRLSGQALARLTSHDHACRVHAELSRRHAERAARCWRP
jgi:enoyl-CoA hydratase/carnithine racemase